MTVTEHDLLRDLTPEQRQAVLSTAREVTCHDGQRLFDEGGLADGCWLIHSGQVALDAVIPGRGRTVIQTLGPGEVLGWSWLIPPYRWHFGAVAVGAAHATVLDTTRLQALAAQDPAVGYAVTRRLLVILLDRLQATRARLMNLYDNPAAAGRNRDAGNG